MWAYHRPCMIIHAVSDEKEGWAQRVDIKLRQNVLGKSLLFKLCDYKILSPQVYTLLNFIIVLSLVEWL